MTSLVVAVAMLASFDVGYFLKAFVWSIGSRIFRSRIHPLQPSVTYGKSYYSNGYKSLPLYY